MPIPPRPSRPARAVAAGLTLALALALATAPPARAQAPGSTPTPAGYVPAGNEALYVESQGLDALADAWQKTSAYKLLNDTPAGPMLEDVLAQLLAQTVIKEHGLKISGPEAVSLLKMAARNGGAILFSGPKGNPDEQFGMIVVRGAYKEKALRAPLARLLTSFSDPKVKAKYADVDGHKIVVQKTPGGEFFGWWVDDARKEDLILIPPASTEALVTKMAARVFGCVEGKVPSIEGSPRRQALTKEEDGVAPLAFGFVDLEAIPPPPQMAALPPGIGLDGVKRLDFRLGFQDREVVAITHAAAPRPHQGIMALLDGPTFDKSGLPPVPEGVTAFSVASIDLGKALDTFETTAQAVSPDLAAKLAAAKEQIKKSTRLRLKEDILAHLGPRIAFYDAPAPKSSGDAAKAAAAPSPLIAMLGSIGAAMGGAIPRTTIVAEIDDAVAFGRSLDELMIQANKSLRELSQSPLIAMFAGAAAGGDASKDATKAAGKGARAASLEFRAVPGANKIYMLALPEGLSKLVPTYVRPTIRVGPKHVALSISPESARAALEVKGGGVAATTFASTLQSAPTSLLFLAVQDPAEAIAASLASFPAKLQEALNTEFKPPGLAPPPAAPPGGGPPGGPGMPGGPPPGYGVSGSGGPPPGYPGSSGSGSGGRPGGPPGSGSGSAGEAKPAGGGVVVTVDPSKLPSASAVKPLIGPASFTVSTEVEGIKLVSRFSFPDLIEMAKSYRSAVPKKPESPAAPGETPPAGDAPGQPQPPGGRNGRNAIAPRPR